MFSDRSALSAKESIAKLSNDALLQDTRFRWKKSIRQKSSSFLRLCFVAPPVCYYFYHVFFGAFQSIRPNLSIATYYESIAKQKIPVYRPEIHSRD